MVVPCYNVEKYADDFFESLALQNDSFENLEVICVNDGSTDGTPEKLEFWAKKLPELIKVIHQENGGLSAARNTGLRVASGEWISFPDPDDFLEENYLAVVRSALSSYYTKPLLAVCAKLVFYHEDKCEFADKHPLTHRFKKRDTYVSTDNMGEHIHLAANSAWLPRALILKHGLEFVGHGWGSFEDAHMINHLLMREKGKTVAFEGRAVYFYRKRSDASSLVDTAKKKKSFWLDQLEFGYLDLLKKGEEHGARAPVFVQRTVLYDMMWRFHHLIRKPAALDSVLDEQETARFGALTSEIMDRIDVQTINDFDLAQCREEHKVALLARYKNTRRKRTAIYLKSFDIRTGIARFLWLCGDDDNFVPEVLLNERPEACDPIGGRQVDILGRVFYRERLLDVRLTPNDHLQFRVNGRTARIKRSGRTIGTKVTWPDLEAASRVSAPSIQSLQMNPDEARLRRVILSPDMENKYRGCWVLMDADTRADDNAEHLYRHLMRTGQDSNAYFILNKDSPDWPRLDAEGFHLLPTRSDDHLAALFNSSLLVSSHADDYVLWPMGKQLFEDLAHYRYIFLQHGVVKDDLSGWLNGKGIRMMVATTQMEYESYVSSDSRYVYTAKEVALTGLPRHDALLEKARAAERDAIVIAPTWRRYLTDETGRIGNDRARISDFIESEYARNWLRVLQSSKLKAQANALGASIIFAPHPNMAMYIDEMGLPDWVEIFDARSGQSYQNLFAHTRLLITDYSSAACEAAYIERPVVYFQFDANRFLSGEHVYSAGFFEYRRDGFGPVYADAEEAINGVCDILRNGPDETHAERARNFFAYRDGQCCERVVNELRLIEQDR